MPHRRHFVRARKQPELSIAPLVDMIFLLLIFVMVSTTFDKRSGFNVDKPEAKLASRLRDRALMVTIERSGAIHLDETEARSEQLAQQVRARLSADRRAVIVEADREVNVGLLVKVLDACKEAGASPVSLGARQPPVGAEKGSPAP